MDFISTKGAPFLAHRLKRASELILEGTTQLIRERGGAGPARSASTILLLSEEGPLSIMEIAYRLRLTHPFIIRLISALIDVGYVQIDPDPADKRRKIVSLTPAGREQAALFRRLNMLLETTFQELFGETGTDLIEALNRLEAAIEKRSIAERVKVHAARQESEAPR